jgi:hypothetical protein
VTFTLQYIIISFDELLNFFVDICKGIILKKKSLCLFLFVILILVACNTIGISSSVKSTDQINTSSLTLVNTTKTPLQTSTTNHPTESLISDYAATDTMEAEIIYNTKIENIPLKCIRFVEYYGYVLSPSHTWLAFICGDNLIIANKSGQPWKLGFRDFWPKEYIDAEYMLNGSLIPIFWSNDEKSFYFSTYYAIDFGSFCDTEFRAYGLYQINIETGVISTVFSPSSFLYHGISSDMNWLVFSTDDNFYLLDLSTWERYPINIDGNLNSINWSKDNRNIVFSTCKWIDKNINPWVERSTISLFSIDTKTFKRLFLIEGKYLNITPSNNQLLIDSYSEVKGDNENQYIFDWLTRELIEKTETPAP